MGTFVGMRRLIVLLATLVLVTSCGSGDDDSDSEGGLALVEDSFVVDLLPVDDSGVSGTADFRAVERETQVTLNLVGTAGTDVQGTLPAHLHFGNCSSLQADVVYVLAPAGDGGESRTTLDLSLDELQTDEFALTVHAAGEDGEHVACGDLADSRAGTG